MSAQRLNERNTRKIAGATGLPVIRAWGHGGYVHDFVTQGHLHGWYSLKTGEWGVETGRIRHYDTCSPDRPAHGQDPLFPDGVPPLTPAEQEAAAAALSPRTAPADPAAPPGRA